MQKVGEEEVGHVDSVRANCHFRYTFSNGDKSK